jgi:RNA polymerase sigma-B factor
MATPTAHRHCRTRKHSHDDAPDTTQAFRRIADLPEGPEKDALRQQVVTAWIPMAERLAGRFRNRGENAEDLRQVAALGLVKAVDRYDPGRGTAFESFAVPTVLGEIKRHFRDNLWKLHVPRPVRELRNQVRTARQELLQTPGGRSPTVKEIASQTGMTEHEVRLGMEALDSYSTRSLEADGHALLDTLGETDPGIDAVVDRAALAPLLRELPEREKRTLYLYFFAEMTQSQIAEIMGISQMHVSRLISRTCTRLRHQILTEA